MHVASEPAETPGRVKIPGSPSEAKKKQMMKKRQTAVLVHLAVTLVAFAMCVAGIFLDMGYLLAVGIAGLFASIVYSDVIFLPLGRVRKGRHSP